jgi:2,3-bisphosphoglycerate-independent phosphoglycerate mutase
MDFRDGDLAYRINLATADWPQIVDRRVGRDLSSREAQELAEEVGANLVLPGASFELQATVEHRGVLVLRADDGLPLSAEVSNTDPAYRREGHLGVALETFEPVVATAEALADTEASRRSAELTNAFVEGAARVLDVAEVNIHRRAEGRLPGNLILTRDGGDHRPRLEPINDRFGITWGCFVEMPVERGIAIALAMEPVDAPRSDPTGFGPAAEEAYATWADLAADASGDFGALYIHLKGPDVPAHDGRAEDKRDVVAAIDRAFFGQLLPHVDPGRTIVAVTADHATSCIRKAHTADPVPLLVSGGPVRPDGTSSFGERACRDGSLGLLRGPQILPRLAELWSG